MKRVDNVILMELESLREEAASPRKSSVPVDFHELFHLQVSTSLQEFEKFKPRLTAYMARKYKERREQLKAHAKKYNLSYQKWQKQVSLAEKSSADAELLKYQPNIIHINSAMTGAGKNEETLADYNDQYRWMRTLAVIPDMLTTNPKCIFNQTIKITNSLISKNRTYSKIGNRSTFLHTPPIQVWTDAEQKVFLQKYLVHAKAFHKIAAFLPFKTCADCVRFYYANKNRLQLKVLLQSYRKGIQLDLDTILGIN